MKKRQCKRYIARLCILLLILMGLMTLSACQTQSAEQSNHVEVSNEPSSEQVEGKLTILTTYSNIELERIVSAFEKLYPEVDIEIEVGIRSSADVGKVEPWDAFLQELATQLMSGEGPDILVDPGVFTPQQYRDSGVVYDLREWMEADPEFSQEEYYGNLFKAYEIEGKQYNMPTRVTLNVAYLNKSLCDIAGKNFSSWDTVTYLDILDIWKTAESQGSLSPDFTLEFMDQRGKCHLFIDAELPDFVDTKEGTCSFDSPAFVQYLEDTKAIPSSQPASEIRMVTGNNILDVFAQSNESENTSLLLLDSVGAETLRSLTRIPENCVGPLILTSRSGNVPFTPALASLVVPNTCANPELAWKFLKFCIEPVDEPAYYSMYCPEGSVDIVQGNTLPISKSNLRAYGELYGKVRVMIEDEGRLSEDFNPETMESPFPNDFFPQIDQALSTYSCAVDSLGRLTTIYTPILQQYYDTDTLSAEMCAKELQQKADIWLRE